jgi:receptor protein-tyrosine kinase
MSLVEKAIKKMQQQSQRAGHAQPPERVFGTLVTTGMYRVPRPDQAEPPVPERVIAIDQVALRTEGLLPPAHQERQIAKQYRQIKRPLLARARTERNASPDFSHRLILMASAMPGEGKTFTAINLAFSMALEKDIRVLLVDADAPKPHISKLFGVDREPGLLDVLHDSTLDVESVILGTDVPNLFVLPAGQRSENATELLTSERMRDVLARSCQRDPRRMVLFDSPPLLMTTESQALTQIAGEIVVVVRAGVTPQGVVLDALSHIDKDKSVSLVLNQSMDAGPAGYFYYGYPDAETSGSAA